MKHIDVTKPAPFDGRDLIVCQTVFNKLQAQLRTVVDAEEANRIAAIIVDLYRQGIRDPEQLKVMIEAARGIFPSQSKRSG
ncbi:hypothetical protein EHI44_30800 [Rhizobium leguminosarum]|nr:hypothetical protein EHI44_30800 [Rhizobium leguminosarum]